jgi:peptidoglycan hydrolase-like protein with peptidoglycan-binding domain
VSHPLKRTRAGPPHRLRRALAALSLAVLGSLVVSTSPALGRTSGGSAGSSGGTTQVGALPAVAAPASASGAVAESRPTLRQGSTGAYVLSMQRRLHGLGYDVGALDGRFGARTFHGVVAFQKNMGMPRDGVVGPTTWARLDRPTITTPRYNHAGLAIEVNLTRQVLYLTRDNRVWRIFDASSGKASTPTPTGNFSDLRSINGWRQSDLGLLWRPHYFYRGYAVHGSTSVPNYPASHGCVRVTIDSMNWLWGQMRTGMPVHVYR